MKIKIIKSDYGMYSGREKAYLDSMVGKTVSADKEHRNMNYYSINNGECIVHLYDCKIIEP